jgi:murein DD-endopeptidase MepM/ murein hydrolase activator NlpD
MRRALPPLVALLTLLCVPVLAHAGESGGASAELVRQAPAAEMGGVAPSDPRIRTERRKRKRLAAARRARQRLAARRRAQQRRRAATPAPAPSPDGSHRFPVAGAFSYGQSGARFGAPRGARSHQGQDLAAAEGTAIVAPRGGVVEAVGYQATGSGHYVVLDGAGEDRDYVFMHMRTGSVTVTKGQSVRLGQKIGEVGNTGRSFGAHLHFEIWTGGGWYTGGRPVDPLPFLQVWETLGRS